MRIPLTILLLSALLSGGCRNNNGPSGGIPDIITKDSIADSPSVSADLTLEARHWADSVVSSMDDQRKAGQVLMPAIYADSGTPNLNLAARYASELHIGGVVLLKGTRQEATALALLLDHHSDISPWVAIDAEWGLGMRLKDMPLFPANGEISQQADELALYEYGCEMARECRALGINMILGPVADVTDRDGIIGRRSFGSDPQRVAELVAAYARGLEDGNIISVAKHFPGHGSPSSDSHRTLPIVNHSRAEIDSLDLPPFRAYIDAGLTGIMTGHLAVPALDPSGTPASFSLPIMYHLLRKELGFSGLVLTDAINMGGAKGFDAVDALLAGADIVVAPQNTSTEIDNIIRALRTGRLPRTILDNRCRRILFFKYLNAIPTGPEPAGPLQPLDSLIKKLK